MLSVIFWARIIPANGPANVILALSAYEISECSDGPGNPIASPEPLQLTHSK